MSEIEKRRKKFMVEIKRKTNEAYFKAMRELLLKGEELQGDILFLILKRSLAGDGLCGEVGPAIDEMRACIIRGQIPRRYEYLLAICSNLLTDNLLLEQREAIMAIMYEVYLNISPDMTDPIVEEIYMSIVNFADSIPALHEDFADDCLQLLYSMSVNIISMIMEWSLESLAEAIARHIMKALKITIILEPEYLSYLQASFSHNLAFYEELLKHHRALMNKKHLPHCNIIRNEMVVIFEHISDSVALNQHPLLFESRLFIDFVISEILEASTSWGEQKALSILTNLLIDYEHKEFFFLLDGLDRAGEQSIHTIVRNLLLLDGNNFYRMKLLKTMVSIQPIYNRIQELVEDYWRDVTDFCVLTLKNEDIEIVRFSAQIILILYNMLVDQSGYLQYLKNLGCEHRFSDVLLEFDERRRLENEEAVQQADDAISMMLFRLEQF